VKQSATDPFPTIAEAFSRTAAKYDAFAEDHPHLARLREKVYKHINRHVPPGSRLLELNAGTGIDAVALAQRGYQVHVTDISPGMLKRVREKVARLNLGDRVSVQQCSFTDLNQIEGRPFDAVFSNLGGLNCIPDLSPVIAQLPGVLRPGGTITWVLMPPICLWEMAEVFRGNFRLAFRRLSRKGTRSHLEGLYFNVYYFPHHRVLDWFGKDYLRLELEGLSVITPTAESKSLARRFPRLYALLARLDDSLSTRPPWWGWGDFYILSARYNLTPRPPSLVGKGVSRRDGG
jgi:ubiquinone/menaquinone biosynthesis C-methylase UbiE